MVKISTPRHVHKLFADMLADEVEVAPDWRYNLVVPYIRHSTSYLAVRDKYRGLKVPKEQLPSDAKLVHQVAQWFDILDIEADDDGDDQTDWWERAGKTLYGFDKAIPSVGHTFANAKDENLIKAGGVDYASIVLNIPLTLTMTDAVSQIKDVFNLYVKHFGAEFGMPLPDSYKAHYKLENSKLRQDTLVKGVDALTMYKAGLPLWQIGNNLELSPRNMLTSNGVDFDQDELADKKRVLSIMAKRLVNTAALIAENAARGRFPSDKLFPEAILGTYKRTAGRPVGSKRPKRINVR